MYKDINSISETVSEVDAIKNSIRNILMTPIGTVPGNPLFGSNLYNVLFSQLDHLTESIAKNYVKEALSEFEDRITLRNINMTRAEEYNRLIIDIEFSYEGISGNELENSSVSLSFNL